MLTVEVVELLSEQESIDDSEHAWVVIKEQVTGKSIEVRISFEEKNFDIPWVCERDSNDSVVTRFSTHAWEKYV